MNTPVAETLRPPSDRQPVRSLTDDDREALAYALSEQQSIPESDRLLPGQRMGIAEFARRGKAIERLGIEFVVELIEGVVCMSPPPDLDGHAVPDGLLSGLLTFYEFATPGVTKAQNGGIWPDPATDSGIDSGIDSVPAPDIILFIDPECGGQMTRDERGRTVGPPELCVEVANSSLLKDTTAKRDIYEAIGVQEYLIYAVRERRLIAYRQQTPDGRGRFVRAETTGEVFRSETFPGLVINGPALFDRDKPTLKRALDEGLATEEHAAFVTRLADAKPKA